MTKQFRKYGLMICLCVPFGCPMAGEFSYQCAVNNSYYLSKGGKLETSTFDKAWKNSTFEVSRQTGKIAGRFLATERAGGSTTTVVNHGSSGMSFTSYAVWGGNYPQFQHITVQEFDDGPEKPFIVTLMGGVYIVTGVCH